MGRTGRGTTQIGASSAHFLFCNGNARGDWPKLRGDPAAAAAAGLPSSPACCKRISAPVPIIAYNKFIIAEFKAFVKGNFRIFQRNYSRISVYP